MKIGKFNIEIDKELKTHKQYSKVWMTRWQLFSMFNIEVYVIADIIFNRAVNINNVVIALISGVIVSLIPYFAKAFLETREDKLMQLKQRQLELQYSNGGYGYGYGNVYCGNNTIYDNSTDIGNLDPNEELG